MRIRRQTHAVSDYYYTGFDEVKARKELYLQTPVYHKKTSRRPG
jgi:hypothetical protein